MKRNCYPSKEEVLKYYIEDLHTVDECSKYFGIGKNKFYSCLKNYQIKRTKEDKSKVYSRIQSSPELIEKAKKSRGKLYNQIVEFVDDNEFKIRDKSYKVNWLKEEYLSKNIDSEHLSKTLDIGIYSLVKILNHYNIKKTNEQRSENIKKTVVSKYNVNTVSKLDWVKEKSKQTCLNKYGVDNPSKSEEIKEKFRKTNLDKYGTNNPKQRDIKHYEIWSSKELFEKFLKDNEENYTCIELSDYFNVCISGLRKHIHEFNLEDNVKWYYSRSHYEDEIIEFIKSIGISNIETNKKGLIPNREIDIYLSDYKMGIEFNGDYWHCDIYHNDHNGRSTYHQDKSLEAEKVGIFLFHIFEYEWCDDITKENIKNRLRTILNKNSTKIAARKCEIVELTKDEKKEFLSVNHFQGNDRSSKCIGLLYNSELVSCMTFTKPKSGKYTWELSRFCNKHNCIVQGGASKLFKYFIKDLNSGDTISSYNDITKTKGSLYEILGFNCVSINQPNYIWIDFHTKDIRTRYQEQKGGEVERMHNAGYNRLCDCGTKTWIYTVK